MRPRACAHSYGLKKRMGAWWISEMAKQARASSSLQRIIVIRHGERLDNVDYMWTSTAARPYDPPLTEIGVQQARDAGKRFLGKVCHLKLILY